MRIGVPKETIEGERRVAMVPEVVRKLTGQDHQVLVEEGAGSGALIPDDAFTEAGASLSTPGARSAPTSWSRSPLPTARRSRGWALIPCSSASSVR
jgi:alanine dehydrogenase